MNWNKFFYYWFMFCFGLDVLNVIFAKTNEDLLIHGSLAALSMLLVILHYPGGNDEEDKKN